MTEHLIRCPEGHLGRIDEEQMAGEVSIVCTGNYGDCDFHGWIDEVEIVEENYGE